MAENNIILEFTGDTSGIKTTIQDIQKLGTTTDAMVANFNAKTKTSEQEVNKLGQAIKNIPKVIVDKGVNDATTAYKKLNDEVVKTTDKHVSLRTEIQKTREAAYQAELQFGKNSQQFKDLIARGGELKENFLQIQGAVQTLGKETKTFDGLISIARGATGAFAGLTAAQALFGDENKDLQASMLKVLATLELLNAVREIAELLEEKSAAFQLVRTIQTKLFTTAKIEQTAATIANTVATEAEVGATESATVATESLNAAMAINPAIIILAAITALGVALYALTDSSGSAAEQTKRLNEQLQLESEFSEILIARLKLLTDEKVRQAEVDKQIATDRGASLLEIRKLEDEQAKHTKELIDRELSERMIAAQVLLQLRDEFYQQPKDAAEAARNLAVQIQKDAGLLIDLQEKKAKEAKIQAVKDSIENEKKAYSALIESIAAQDEAEDKQRERRIERERQDIQLIIDGYKIKLQDAEQFSKAYLDIQIKQAREELLLASNGKSQEEISLLRTAERQKEENLISENHQHILQEAKKFEESETAIQQLSSDERLQRLKDSIELERQTKVEAALNSNSPSGVTLANNDAAKAILEATRKDEIERAQLQLSLRKSTNEATIKLDEFDLQKVHKAKLDDIEWQESVEIKQIEDSEDAEDVKEQKITKIHLDAITARQEVNKDDALKHIQEQEKQLAADQQHELAVLALQKNTGSGIGAHIQNAVIAKQDSDIRIKAFQQEMELDKKKFEAKAESEQDFLNNQRKLQDEIAAQRAASDRDIAKTSIDIAKQGLDSIISNWQAANDQYYETRIQTLERAKDAELNMDNVSNVQKAAIRNKYAKEEAALKLQQWKADQQAKEISAVINTALAITNAFATAPWPVDIIQAALAAATGAAQIAIIASQKPPAFATGTADAPPGFKLVGERGPELIWTPGHERIITHAESMHIMHKYNIPAFSAPTLLDTTMGDLSKGFEFDYNKFGDVMAKKLKDNPQLVVNIDKHGLDTYIKSSMGRSKLLDNRIKF